LAYSYIPEEQKVEFPPRIKEIADEFERHGFSFKLDPLNDMESSKEMAFERKAKKHPESVKTEVLSIHRIRDEFNNKEYLLYKIKKYAEDADPIESWMGKRPRFDTTNIIDDNTGDVVNKRITKWNMVYTIDWNEAVFDDIVKNSINKKIPFYIADSSDEYHTNWTGTNIRIKDQKAFRNLTHEELVILDEQLKVSNQARTVKLKTT
jgi:hypothetical protein